VAYKRMAVSELCTLGISKLLSSEEEEEEEAV
jgi:hypothetical protein